jgi:hypothetical protein
MELVSETIYSSRKESKAAGGKFYHGGKPCATHGEMKRYTCSGECVACKKVTGKIRYESPENRAAAKARGQTQKRKDYRKATEKVRRQTPKYKAAHKVYEQTPKRKLSNQISNRNNKAKRRGAEGIHTLQEWLDLLDHYDHKCVRCGRHVSECRRRYNQNKPCLEQDHVIPIIMGGSNWITNIQPLCMDCNGGSSKGTKSIDYRPDFWNDTIRPI